MIEVTCSKCLQLILFDLEFVSEVTCNVFIILSFEVENLKCTLSGKDYLNFTLIFLYKGLLFLCKSSFSFSLLLKLFVKMLSHSYAFFMHDRLRQWSENFLSECCIICYTTVRGPDILRNVVVSGNVAFYQINKFSVDICFFVIDKIASRGGFGPRAVVWRPWSKAKFNWSWLSVAQGSHLFFASVKIRSCFKFTFRCNWFA